MYTEKENELIRKIQTTNANNHDRWNKDIDRLFEHKEKICGVVAYFYGALEGHPDFWKKEKRVWKEVYSDAQNGMNEINAMCKEYDVPNIFTEKEINTKEKLFVEICEQYEDECDAEYIRMQKEAGYE